MCPRFWAFSPFNVHFSISCGAIHLWFDNHWAWSVRCSTVLVSELHCFHLLLHLFLHLLQFNTVHHFSPVDFLKLVEIIRLDHMSCEGTWLDFFRFVSCSEFWAHYSLVGRWRWIDKWCRCEPLSSHQRIKFVFELTNVLFPWVPDIIFALTGGGIYGKAWPWWSSELYEPWFHFGKRDRKGSFALSVTSILATNSLTSFGSVFI